MTMNSHLNSPPAKEGCPKGGVVVSSLTAPSSQGEYPLPLRVLPLGRGRSDKTYTDPMISVSWKCCEEKQKPKLPSCQGGVPKGRGGCLVMLKKMNRFLKDSI